MLRKYTYGFFTSDNRNYIEGIMKNVTPEIFLESCRELVEHRCFACHQRLFLNWVTPWSATHYWVSCHNYDECFIAQNRQRSIIEIPDHIGNFTSSNYAIRIYLSDLNKIEWRDVEYEEENFDWIYE